MFEISSETDLCGCWGLVSGPVRKKLGESSGDDDLLIYSTGRNFAQASEGLWFVQLSGCELSLKTVVGSRTKTMGQLEFCIPPREVFDWGWMSLANLEDPNSILERTLDPERTLNTDTHPTPELLTTGLRLRIFRL